MESLKTTGFYYVAGVTVDGAYKRGLFHLRDVSGDFVNISTVRAVA